MEWFLELIPYFSEAEIKLIGAIMRTGGDEWSEAGQPCVTLRARLQALADDAGIALRSAILASQSLEAEGALTVFPSSHPHGVNAYRLYVSLPRRLMERIKKNSGAKIAPLHKNRIRSAKTAPLNNKGEGGGGVVVDDDDSISPGTDTTTPPRAPRGALFAPLLKRLQKLGVLTPERFIADYTPERIEAALAYVTDPLSKHVRNPAGFLIYLLEAAGDIPLSPSEVSKSLKEAEGEIDPTEKYIKGKYGHLVKR